MISQMPGVHTSASSCPSVSISCSVLGPLPLGHSAFWTSSLNLSTLWHFFPGNLLSYLSESWPVLEASLVVTTLDFSVTSFSRLLWLASQAPSLQATVSTVSNYSFPFGRKKILKIRNSALTCCPGTPIVPHTVSDFLSVLICLRAEPPSFVRTCLEAWSLSHSS